MTSTFSNIDKLLDAFYPLFKKWWIQNKKSLLKIADHCITLKRSQFVPGCLCADFKKWCTKKTVKKSKQSATNKQPDYVPACTYLYEFLNTHADFSFEGDILQHFSTVLGTADKKADITIDNLAEKVTPVRRYKSVPCTVVYQDTDFTAEPEITETDEDAASKSAPIKLTEGTDEVKSVPPATISPTQQTPVLVSPAKKAKSQSTCDPIPKKPKSEVLTWPSKLVLDAHIARPEEFEFNHVRNGNFLPVKSLSGNALFNSFLRHCCSGNEHMVLVSRPFKSLTEKVAGLPLLVRQVLFGFLASTSLLFLMKKFFYSQNLMYLLVAWCTASN